MPESLRKAIRDVPDFPKEGIVFKDISPLLSDPALLKHSITLLAEIVQGQRIDKVVGIDARGFIFAAPLAIQLDAGFIPIRKKGKLPWKTNAASYQLEYGEDTVEIHQDAIKPGENILLVDDLLATGGTAAAALDLLQKSGANIIGYLFLIELTFLNGREKLNSSPIHSILDY